MHGFCIADLGSLLFRFRFARLKMNVRALAVGHVTRVTTNITRNVARARVGFAGNGERFYVDVIRFARCRRRVHITRQKTVIYIRNYLSPSSIRRNYCYPINGSVRENGTVKRRHFTPRA